MENLEEKINELIQKWYQSGWLDVTKPELFIMGTGIKKLVEENSSECQIHRLDF